MRTLFSRSLLLLLFFTMLSKQSHADFPDSLAVLAGTGVMIDGTERYITLLGLPFDARRLYMTGLYLAVDDDGPVRLQGDAANGYEPRIIPCDFTGDGNEEILITASTGGSGGIVNGLVCEIGADSGITAIFDTGKGVLTPVTGRFLDGYRASIAVLDTSVIIDLSSRRDYYERTGTFSEGKPTGDMEPWGDPYGLISPVDSDGDSVCDLECLQSVSGAAHVDRIAIVRTILTWNEEGWRVADIEILPRGDAGME